MFHLISIYRYVYYYLENITFYVLLEIVSDWVSLIFLALRNKRDQLESIINNREKLMEVMIKELKALKKKFGSARKTKDIFLVFNNFSIFEEE